MRADERIKRRLKLRDLETLLAVAQAGSMAKAARQLSISQPAVSKAISELEDTLGVPMFDRTAKGVETTAYGRALIKWANAVFDDIQQGVKEIEFISDPSSGELRIGATEPMIAGILPVIVARLAAQYPRMGFQITPYGARARQYRDLRERRIDLTLGRVLDPGSEEFRTEILFDEPLLVVAGSTNPLVKRRKIGLAELADEPWTLPYRDTVAGQMMAEAFEASGLDFPRSGILCNSVQMHCALLATGPYLAMLPESLLRFGHFDAMKVLPVDLPVRPIPVGITALRNRTISPIVSLFIECARHVAKPLASPARNPVSKSA
jgi:DNA-binding transcriptional LysR family regulator